MKRKKISIIFISLVLIFLLCGCGAYEYIIEDDTTKATTTTTQEKTITTENFDNAKIIDNKQLVAQLINSVGTIVKDHANETINFNIDVSATMTGTMGTLGDVTALSTINGDIKYSIDSNYTDIKTVVDFGKELGGSQTEESKMYQIVENDKVISYIYAINEDKWYRVTETATIENTGITSDLNVDIMENIVLRENDTEYIVTCDSYMSKLNPNLRSLTGTTNASTTDFIVHFIIKFNKETKIFTSMKLVFDNFVASGYTVTDFSLLVTNKEISNGKLKVPEDIVKNALDGDAIIEQQKQQQQSTSTSTENAQTTDNTTEQPDIDSTE